MAVFEFVRTEYFFESGDKKSVAIVSIDGRERRVEFWGEIVFQHSKEDVREYLCAEALIQAGLIEQARDLISIGASGTLTKDENNVEIDTRNWRQNWLDANPLPPKPIEPKNDPLL